MNELKVETPLNIGIASNKNIYSEHQNFAIIGLPEQYGDPAELQAQAVHFFKSLGTQGKYNVQWDPVLLKDVKHDEAIAMGNNPDLIPLIQYYVDLAAEWGFTNNAKLRCEIQIDRQENDALNVHRDGIGELDKDLQAGKHIRGVRFVYPIGRPGTILYPSLKDEGTLIYTGLGIIESPTKHEQDTSARLLELDDAKKQQLVTKGNAMQLIAGNTLVFDMMNSPWHQAPHFTKNGAILTVDIMESWQ